MLGILSTVTFLLMVVSWAVVQPARERLVKTDNKSR